MIRELGRSLGNTVLESIGRASSRVQERRPLPADVLESDEAYLVVFDAPGATGGDVQVKFEDNAVQVRIDRFREYKEGYEMRLPGRGMALDGEMTLPADADVDPEAASATLRRNGSLEVRVPKVEPDVEPDEGEAGDAVETDAVDDGDDADSGPTDA